MGTDRRAAGGIYGWLRNAKEMHCFQN